MMNSNLQIAIEAARAAGKIIMEGYATQNSVDVKENKSQVTETDKNSEKDIIQILEAKSKFPILAEETRNIPSNTDSYWVVDPLDGTTNFIRRIPLCAVSIALIENNTPTVGVIFNPITGEMFYAQKGGGAFLDGERIYCSKESGILFANSGYDKKHKDAFAQVVIATTDYSIRKFGTTAYELATVARGGADAFVAWGDELWDHAAGILLVRESGGIVTNWKNEEWNTSSKFVLAGNKQMQAGLVSIVGRISNELNYE